MCLSVPKLPRLTSCGAVCVVCGWMTPSVAEQSYNEQESVTNHQRSLGKRSPPTVPKVWCCGMLRLLEFVRD